MNRKTPFLPGEYYHIYNRGTDKRVIFLDDTDRKRFMLLLYLCNTNEPVNIEQSIRKGQTFADLWKSEKNESVVDIGAYCLMPNHFHILLQERVEHGISSFARKLLTAYTMYFNRKYGRGGRLFEGAFKSKHIDNGAYFNYIFSYIHLNPVKLIDSEWKEKGISDPEVAKQYMNSYLFSSYFDYFVGNRMEKLLLNTSAFPDSFANMNDFEDIIASFQQ